MSIDQDRPHYIAGQWKRSQNLSLISEILPLRCPFPAKLVLKAPTFG